MKKKLLFVGFTVLLLSILTFPAHATTEDAIVSANGLHALGLFNGTGTDATGKPIYDLDRAPTRNEAVTMLVRLLGKENEAKSCNWDTPFMDVADWAKPYVGYAYEHGLTNGTSATTFGGDATITATQYITFLLRALGYESGVDFEVNTSYQLGNRIGLTESVPSNYGMIYDYSNKDMYFNRGHIALLSASALQRYLKDGNKTLIGKLYEEGVVSQEALQSDGMWAVSSRVESCQRLETPQNVRTYYDESDGSNAILQCDREDGLFYDYYYATSYNGPYLPGGGGTGSVFTNVYYKEGTTYYYIMRCTDYHEKSDGTLVSNYSNWSDPVSLNSATAEKPPADPNKTLTTSFNGATVYYPAAIGDPTPYLQNAYASARAQLKYPAMAMPSSSSTILSFDEDSGDLYLFGNILGCNAFGVYSDCSYCAIFKDANNPYDYSVVILGD